MLTPEQLESLIRALRTRFEASEARLLEIVAAAIKAEARNPSPFGTSGPRANRLRAAILQTLADLLTQGRGDAARAVAEATRIGRRRAEGHIPRVLLDAQPRFPRTPQQNLVHPPAALMPTIGQIQPQLLASAMGLYRQVLTDVTSVRVGGTAGRLRIAQKALDQASHRGITAIRDRSGRRWNMVSYIEMATRTACLTAANDGYAALMVEHGFDIVQVSEVANCSPLCAPYQGRLLSLTGNPGDVQVVATLAEARAHGLHHPNCRHALKFWAPGYPVPDPDPVDPAGYEATQQLRRLERRIRAQKKRLAVAVTPQAEQVAKARIRALQKDVRVLVDDTGIPRLRRREQIGVPL